MFMKNCTLSKHRLISWLTILKAGLYHTTSKIFYLSEISIDLNNLIKQKSDKTRISSELL